MIQTQPRMPPEAIKRKNSLNSKVQEPSFWEATLRHKDVERWQKMFPAIFVSRFVAFSYEC